MSSVTLIKTDKGKPGRTFTESLSAAGRSLSALDVVLLSLTASLFFLIAVSSHLLPLNTTLYNSADVLFIEDVARDLNAGGNLFDWRLTQAPYLFPDIAVARILAALAPGVGDVGVYFHALFGVAMVALVFWLCRLCRVAAFVPVLSTAVLYSTTYIGGLTGDAIPVYFGLIGHHCGVLVCILLAFAAVILFVERKTGDAASLSLLYFSAFAGVISDSLFAVAFVPVLFAYVLLALIRREMPASSAARLIGVTLLAVVLGKAFGYANPFPQDREFMQIILAQFPSLTANSFKNFGKDFVQYVLAVRLSAFIAAAYLVSAVAALVQLVSVVRGNRPAASPMNLLALFVLIAAPVTILLQNIVGLYGSIDSSRQWAGIVFASIAFGAMLVVHLLPAHLRMHKLLLGAVQVILIFHTSKALAQNKGVTRDESHVMPLVTCMKASGLPQGWFYVADYWVARPLRLYSGGAFGVMAYSGLVPFFNASNIVDARKAVPRFIIAGISMPYKEVVSRFGPPRAEYCPTSLNGSELKVLDYSESPAALEFLRNNAIKAY